MILVSEIYKLNNSVYENFISIVALLSREQIMSK